MNTKLIKIFFISTIFIKSFLYFGNNCLQISKYILHSNKIKNDYSIVHISDLHDKNFGIKQDYLLKNIKKCKPNFIFVTGDMYDGGNEKHVLNFFNGCMKIAPTYYVLGNHEERFNNEILHKLLKKIEKSGTIILNNQIKKINDFYIIGLKNKNSNDDTLKKILKNKENFYKILLVHKPNYVSNYIKNNIDLVFSGHAHGGQWRIPFIGGLYAPDQGIFPKLTNNIHKNKNTYLVISRGLGNKTIYPRLNNRPEIVHLILKGRE